MISLAFIALFFCSIALGVVSVLVTYQLISNYNASFLKNYFYYIISFYAFAIYAIWGQIIVRTLLEQSGIESLVVERTANFLPMLGLPFLMVSWIMLINMAYGFFEVKVSKWWRMFHLLLFSIIMFGVWFGYAYFDRSQQFSNISIKYIAVTFVTILSFSNYLAFLVLIIYFGRKKKVRGQHFFSLFAWFLLSAFVVRWLAAFFAFSGPWVLGLVILIYFTTNLLPLLYLKIKADEIFSPIKANDTNEDMVEMICMKYKISKREREIVRHICIGKTNQQIADELFISLQTVKDHTHRIYSKIGINSRMKLVQMVNA